MKTHLVAIDTETGGLIPGYHALLSLAAVPTWEAEPFHVHIWPDGHEIDPDSLKGSGYDVDLWRDRKAVRLATALELFREWLEKAPVEPWKLLPLAHNAGFDRAFLDASFRFIGRRSPLGRGKRGFGEGLGCDGGHCRGKTRFAFALNQCVADAASIELSAA